MASGTGSLIQLHNHDNYDVLEELEDSGGKLYYNKNNKLYIGRYIQC